MTIYKDLGAEKGADAASVRRAYRKAASKHHPDKGGDAASFQVIQRAYDILSDPARRASYDATGEDAQEPSLQALAMQTLANLFLNTVDGNDAIEHVDLCAVVKGHVEKGRADCKKGIASLEFRKKKFLAAQSRLSFKGEHDVAANAIEQRLKELDASITNGKKQLEMGEIMLEMLKDYSYASEKAKVEQGAFTPTHNPFTIFTGFR